MPDCALDFGGLFAYNVEKCCFFGEGENMTNQSGEG